MRVGIDGPGTEKKQLAAGRSHHWARRAAARGGILLFLVMALEFVIMISPFAWSFLRGPSAQSGLRHAQPVRLE
jgi:hypothetical protein